MTIIRRFSASAIPLLVLLAFSLTALGGCSKAIKLFDSFSDKSARESKQATASAKVGDVDVSVDYSRPAKKGREIFGKLIPYGEVWRTGANEATEIVFSKDVTIAGKRLAAGRYTLCTIPGAEKWTIVFNKTLGQWGAFFYDAKDDVLRVEVPSGASESVTELLTIGFEPSDSPTQMTIAWDKVRVAVPIGAASAQ